MTNPATPSGSDGGFSTGLRPSAAGLSKKLASQNPSPGHSSSGMSASGNSLPTTPAKLIDFDPAILLSIKSRDRSREGSAEKQTDHLRNASNVTVIPSKPENKSATQKTESNRTKTTMLERSWRAESDPFFAGPGTALTNATTAVDSEFKNVDRDEMSPTPKPREDRSITEISAENAQGYFNAEFCVFVANLSVGCSDTELETETKEVFSRFGTLFVKIRRDRNGMPYAFCQYTTAEAAKKAIDHGHALMICGRPCRVEQARANRSVYLSRTAGGNISEDQAREILNKTGPITKLWYPTDTDKEVYRLPTGIWATFTYFQDARDVHSRFKDSKEYRVEIPYSPEDHERQVASRNKISPYQSTPLRGLRAGFRWTGSAQRFSGPSSVFIGNLPLSASVESIRETFESCGAVRTIEIVGKAVGNVPGLSAFAFVDFASEGGAKNALHREINFNGRRLRIEPRESQEQFFKSGAAHVSGSPRVRGPLTPRTPAHSATTESIVKPAAPASTPAPMMPVYENGQQTEGGPPQTPAQQIFHHPYVYGSPYGGYGGFYPGTQGDAAAGQPPVPGYGPGIPDQAAMGYYAYPGYYPGYNVPYTSPAQVNAAGNSNSTGTPEGAATVQGTADQNGPTS